MDQEKEIIELKAKNKNLEIRLGALINLLCEEGVVTRDEIEDEYKNLLKGDEEE